MRFEDMNIEESILGSLKKMGFEKPTKIQCETIPLIKQGYDVIGQSETGSGKTAAFGIPLIEKTIRSGIIQALVLAPTRELSLQIADDLKRLSHLKGIVIQTVYGGVSMEPQISGLRRADVVVGTPGRIMDHMRRGTVNFSNLKIFVLDEADKMIDMGFFEDIEEIERHIPRNRQTLLFSATMPDRLIEIRERFTRNAKKIRTETNVSNEILKQYYYDIRREKKFSLLVHLISQENPGLSIVFCNSRRDADIVARNLQNNGINAKVIHGGLSQQQRERVLEEFHNGIMKVLVATDVAARGLDIKNVTHIFNYSIPKNMDDYTNRIGRTARAGNSGKAVSLLSKEDHGSFRTIIRSFDYAIEKVETPDFRLLPFNVSRFGEREFGERGFSGRRFGESRFGRRRFGRFR